MKMSITSASIVLLLSMAEFGVCLNCPNLCQCVSSMMDCKQPGLEALPPAPSNKLEMVVIANQTFLRKTLDREALKPYRSPEHDGQVRLRLLKIRNCNIVSIASNAFANLGSQLEELDLSGNPLQTIEAHAFPNLRLKSLFLNNLNNPVIHDQAFSGIIEVHTLSLQNSRLTSLPLRPILELVNHHGLKSLFIQGNQIAHLAPAFEPVFKLLQSFELGDNPWFCDCNLRWLIQMQKWNRLSKLNGNNDDSRGDIRQPTCVSPVEFAGYTFDEITLQEGEGSHFHSSLAKRPVLSCIMPRIEHIEVDLRQSDSEKEFENVAKIVCQLKGAPDLAVSWMYHDVNGEIRNVTDMTKNQEEKKSLPFTFHASQPKQLISKLAIKKVSETDRYSCVGQNVLGNVSVTVNIRWPPKPVTSDIAFKQEIVGGKSMPDAMSGDFLHHMRPTEYSILAKRFSLMDLIGAVIGTFLVTMLMFILAYRTSKLYGYRRAKLRSQSDPMLGRRDHNKHNPDGTSSSAASSSLLKFSQLQVPTRYPPDYAQTNYPNPPMIGGLLISSKQRDSGTFTSQSTSSSQNVNAQSGAYETVYNESSANQLMYETPSENLVNTAAAACHQNQQSFIFPFSQAGYPIMFGSTLPSQQSSAAAYALGVSSPSVATFIPPPPSVQQPSLPRSIQSQTGPLQHVYSSTIHTGERYQSPNVSGAVQASNPAPQLNHVT